MSCWRVSAKSATPTNAMSEKRANNSEVRAAQGASQKYPTFKLGLDVHAATIVVVRMLDHSGPQPAQKFTPSKFLERVQTQLSLAEEVHRCYEAGAVVGGINLARRDELAAQNMGQLLRIDAVVLVFPGVNGLEIEGMEIDCAVELGGEV